ncbi:MAG: CocE/NonD family hydrolase [bacterium]
MNQFLKVNPESIRTVNPSSWPQYPFNEEPKSREISLPKYSVFIENSKTLTVRDGIDISYDVYRPNVSGEKFPALLSWSPYTRQLQPTMVPIGQNEAGLTEFWVPRGYVQVIADVRGSNDSGGSWDHWGPEEQKDLKEMIEFIANEPWCNGKVGMVGCSYFGMSQLLAAEQQPEGLSAIFPYDAMTDLYRDAYYHGGIYSAWARFWFTSLMFLNHTSGRVEDLSGFNYHFNRVLSGKDPLDCEYFQERSSWSNLGKIEVPTYLGCDWNFYGLHLRGAFEGWDLIPQSTPKRMLIGPEPQPRRPFGVYHFEALRWYDQYLKGLDSGVNDGPPINIFIQGENTWRAEKEWPLERTVWKELFLDGEKLTENVSSSAERSYKFLPGTPESKLGEPKLVFRTEPTEKPFEITGPLVLKLFAISDQDDTDWFVFIKDEFPDGSDKILTRGFLKASHRALDFEKSKNWRPWHPHNKMELIEPGEVYEYEIEIVPTCNLFLEGHSLKLEISSCDPVTNLIYTHEPIPRSVTNTILTGKDRSRLIAPFIPR